MSDDEGLENTKNFVSVQTGGPEHRSGPPVTLLCMQGHMRLFFSFLFAPGSQPRAADVCQRLQQTGFRSDGNNGVLSHFEGRPGAIQVIPPVTVAALTSIFCCFVPPPGCRTPYKSCNPWPQCSSDMMSYFKLDSY